MCRMLAFWATHPTPLECSLVGAPHSLLAQSREDLEGFAHADGWGVAQWRERGLSILRHPKAAHEEEDYREHARKVRARRVIAHVRQATAGDVCLENTHPFVEPPWVFVHNGTIRHFAEGVGERMLARVAPRHREAIRGTTDSEVLFRLLMTRLEARPERPPVEVLGETIRAVAAWCAEAGPCANLGLNVFLSDGDRLVGARWQQSLWHVEREGVLDAALCGAAAPAPAGYRAVLVASEPLTDEAWAEVPERTLFEVGFDEGRPRFRLG